MTRIRLAPYESDGVIVAEVVGIAAEPDGYRHLGEEAVPPATRVLLDDLAAVTGTAAYPVVLDCRGFDTLGAAGLGFLHAAQRAGQRAGRPLVLCVSTSTHAFLRAGGQELALPSFTAFLDAVAAARGQRA
jgi:anti-anti-sigma regulatory factor